MKLPLCELHVPRTLDEALSLRAALGSDAKLLAGGQSLLPMMRYRVVRPYALIDISRLAELAGVEAGEALRIGAAVTHADIESCGHDGPVFDLLRAHASEIAFLPVRNKGTVVGSLVHADPAADWPLAFLALEATVELRSLRGRRSIALGDFVQGAMDTDVQLDEIAVAVSVPARTRGLLRWGRFKLMHRAGEFAAANALAIQAADGEWACWAGSVDPMPLRLDGTAALLPKTGTAMPHEENVFEQALAEIRAQRPHCEPLAALRHARAVARAARRALQGKPE